VSTINEISAFSTVWTIWLGLIGQTIFCAIFATRPWRKYRISRAYFNKSMAMEAIFVRSALLLSTRGMRPNLDDPLWVSLSAIALNAYVLWAVWYQLYALLMEMRYGHSVGADAAFGTRVPKTTGDD
jgi:hypothetical protein